MLNVTTHERSDHVVVTLAGRLDGGPSCETLSKAVKAHLDAGQHRFLIDLAEVEWMSSCGIGCLIAAYTSVRRSGGSLALRSPNRRVLSALEVTELVPRVFELVDSESEAAAG
jgi:anti-sigma B factor antagonist